MDRYNLWDDDAEEILLDLGFGCDEPDLMGHVPARFLSNQSKARGMTLQLFIEAQKNRLNSENPEFHTSIRQLEVLQMVNMKFSSLAGSSSSLLKKTLGKHVPSDVQERKRHIGMLYRRASKKLLGQIQNTGSHDIKILAASSPSSVPTESLQFASSSVEEKVQDKTFKSGLMETVCQRHFAKEEEASSEGQSQLQEVSSMQKHQPGTEGTLVANNDSRNGTPSKIQRVDESGFALSIGGRGQNSALSQSDGKRFPEESLTSAELSSPGKDDNKVFSGVLVWNTDTQSGEKPGSSPPSLLSFSATASIIDRHLPTFGYYSPEFLVPVGPVLSSELLERTKSDSKTFESDEKQKRHPVVSLSVSGRKQLPPQSSFKLQRKTHSQDQILDLPFHFTTSYSFFTPNKPSSLRRSFEDLKNLDTKIQSTALSAIRQMDLINGHSPSSVFPDLSKLEDGSHAVTLLSSKKSILDYQPSDLFNSNNPDGLTGPESENTSDPGEVSTHQEIKRSQDANEGSTAPLPVHSDLQPPMDQTSLDVDDTMQSNGKEDEENEVTTNVVQTCTETKTVKPDILTGSHKDSFEANQKEFCGMLKKRTDTINTPNSEAPVESSVFYDKISQSKNACNDLDSQSLLLGCESSVDDSDGEREDAEAFFQQLDADGRVHWAEHIQVTPVHEEFGSCEDLSPGDSEDQYFLSSTSMSSSSTVSATEQISKNTTLLSNKLSSWIVEPLPPPSANQDLKQSNHSISFPSSHIVKRKDVPYSTESKPVNPLHNVRLNLSTPFQAVRSWTELRIQLNAKKILHGSVHTFPNHWNLTDTEQTTTPSRFLMSSKWHSHEGILTAIEKNNTSLNPRHWTDDQKERDAKENGVLSCDCSRARGGRSKEGIKPANSPNAADEFKKTILCLQRFCSVLNNMEDQISVDQSEVYSILSNADRENIRYIEKLRFAVKMEAVELEMQLKEQFHQDNEILKMSMLQLLDEQSRFCSQVSLPGSVPKRPV